MKSYYKSYRLLARFFLYNFKSNLYHLIHN